MNRSSIIDTFQLLAHTICGKYSIVHQFFLFSVNREATVKFLMIFVRVHRWVCINNRLTIDCIVLAVGLKAEIGNEWPDSVSVAFGSCKFYFFYIVLNFLICFFLRFSDCHIIGDFINLTSFFLHFSQCNSSEIGRNGSSQKR